MLQDVRQNLTRARAIQDELTLGMGQVMRENRHVEGPSNVPTPAARVLVVEDHADSAQVLALSLTLHGYEVLLAGTVAEAEVAAGRGIDLVVSDIRLPDGSGFDLMRRLRQVGPIPGIALTGYGDAEDVERSREAGFRAHLIKPVDPDRLLAAIARVLESVANDGRDRQSS